MTEAPPPAPGSRAVVDRPALATLIDVLRADGHTVVGPTVREGAIVYDELSSDRDLPEGWTDEQEAGRYRLARRADAAVFGYAVGPHAWKRFLFPPEARLFQAKRQGGAFEVTPEPQPRPRYAFLGARSCELAAIAIQDRVFLAGPYPDPVYAARREGLLLVAVQCAVAGGTCFCASMDTGPRARAGFDLALTETIDERGHRFLVEVGTEAGARVLARVPHRAAEQDDVAQAEAISARTAASMGRALPTAGLKEALQASYEHPHWDDVARRCLTCANCTLACPTCFCSSIEDTSDLTGDHAERWRRWDSCFSLDFSYLHGGSVRASGRSRYRQWLVHKLSTWYDQFGTSGCVGCGRCITWCPVGIDITAEVRALRAGT